MTNEKGISEKEAKDYIKRCSKAPYYWSSDPMDPCNKCKYRIWCKSQFFGKKDPERFHYDEEAMKEEALQKIFEAGNLKRKTSQG